MLWHGEQCEYRVMVLDLLGPSLEDLFHFCSQHFSLKTVLTLADQLIYRFQYIHSKGLIHRDIKPDNILMGDGIQGNNVYVADMGLATEFRDAVEGEDDARSRNIPVLGTVHFASINAHLGVGKQESSPAETPLMFRPRAVSSR